MMSFAVLAIVKATLVCGVAFSLARLFRRTRASVRHLLFAVAFAALVVVPGIGALLPTVTVTIPVAASAPALRIPDPGPAVLSSADAGPSDTSTPSDSRVLAQSGPVTIAQVLTTTWMIGMVLCLIPVGVGAWQVRCLRQSASLWVGGRTLVRKLAPALGIGRRIDALLHEDAMGPLTCGVLKPAIILPAAAQYWDDATLIRALRHELEHVARWDFLTHCLTRTVCAAYWFHPLVWAAWRRLQLEAERACDDAVLQESDARDYASLLVSIARCRQPANSRRTLLAMAGHGDLAARVAAVLDGNQSRGRVGRRWATALIAAGAIVILGVAPISVARAVAHAQTGPAGPPLKFETVSITRSAGVGTPGAKLAAGYWTATNMTMRSVLFFAYGHPNEIGLLHQIDNAPGWVDSDRFDIVATMPPGARPEQVSQMLRLSLAERFRLVTHLGSKEFPLYALVLAKQDGTTGKRMTPSQIDCRAKPGCGLTGTTGRLTGRGMTMAQLATVLPRHLAAGSQIRMDRPLIDRTDLGGRFDFTLEWTPDAVHIRWPNQIAPELPVFRPFAFPLESNTPNFLAALEDQLGLRFDNRQAPEPVLVIDNIEPPR